MAPSTLSANWRDWPRRTPHEDARRTDGAGDAAHYWGGTRDKLESALRELIADAERPTLLGVANQVCARLPDYWELRLCMERGAAWVTLHNENGDCLELQDPMDDSLVKQIEDATQVAIDAARANE